MVEKSRHPVGHIEARKKAIEDAIETGVPVLYRIDKIPLVMHPTVARSMARRSINTSSRVPSKK